MPEQIYNTEHRYKVAYDNIFSKDYKEMSVKNKAVLNEFLDLLTAEGLTTKRKYKYLYFFKNIFKWLNKDIINVNKEDLIKLVTVIKDQPYKPSTIRDYVSAVKKFYKTITIIPKYEHLEPIYFWLYDRRNKFYSTKIHPSHDKSKEEWFTEEDVMKVIDVADNFRDKCFISIMATQGTRPEELLTLRVKDISTIKDGLKIKVAGKTGSRDLFIYESFVIDHTLNHLKTLSNGQEYIFEFGLKNGNKILKNLCKKAGVKKRAYLYKLRKFSVTIDRIAGLSAGAMEQKYGWVKGTKAIACYDKSISKDYRKEIQAKHGLKKEETPKSIFADKMCVRCGEKNPYDKQYCGKCSLKLDTTREELIEQQGLEKEMYEMKQEIKKFKEIMKYFFEDKKIKGIIDSKTFS